MNGNPKLILTLNIAKISSNNYVESIFIFLKLLIMALKNEDVCYYTRWKNRLKYAPPSIYNKEIHL